MPLALGSVLHPPYVGGVSLGAPALALGSVVHPPSVGGVRIGIPIYPSYDRYVRLVVTAKNSDGVDVFSHLALKEMTFNGEPNPVRAFSASSPDTSFDGGTVPANAVDGNTATYWQPVAATATPTLEVDRGTAGTAYRSVRVQFYPSVTFIGINYTIETSTDDAIWTTRVTIVGNTQTERTHDFGEDVTDRYYRIVVTSFDPAGVDAYAHLAIVEFIANSYPYPTASSTAYDASPPWKGMDGDDSSFWQGAAGATPITYHVDRGPDPGPMETVRLLWFGVGYEPIDYHVDSSNDDVQWTRRVTVTGAGGTFDRFDYVLGDYPGDVTAELLDPFDPTSVIRGLPITSDRQWLDQLNDAGNFSTTFQNDDPALADVAEGSLIRFSLKGVKAAIGVCETAESTLYKQGEGAAQTTTWTGRLYVALMERAVVYPSRGIRVLPIQEDRSFDYTEPSFDDSSWVAPANLGALETARFFAWYLSPLLQFLFPDGPDSLAKGFPDPFVPLLWAPGGTLLRGRPAPAESGGDCYFRQPVSIPNNGTYTLWGICDDTAEWFVDGAKVCSVDAANGFQTASGNIDLSAGEHTFAFHVNNRLNAQVAWAENPGGNYNPGYGAWSLFRAGAINVNGFIAHSDPAATKVAPYAPQVPGMTPGRVLRLVKEEAETRGVLMPSLGCSDVNDRNGSAWPTVVISTRVGTDYLTLLKEMSTPHIDFAMRAGAFTLDVWKKNQRGGARSVPLGQGTVESLGRKGENV